MTEDDFLSRCEQVGDCWEWKNALSHGYGRVWHEGKVKRTHRVSYELFIGPIPTAMVVRHRCDNRKCVNPAHLEVGTQSDNIKDSLKRNRAKNWAGPTSKLTEIQVEEIRKNYVWMSKEKGSTALAKRYGVSPSCIMKIVNHDSWS